MAYALPRAVNETRVELKKGRQAINVFDNGPFLGFGVQG
jgi:hypothetical protein